jgi:uncharacterized protein YjeT (DUF2065 family)
MDHTDLLAALCLVLVIEGLILLVVPDVWKRMAAQLADTPERALRVGGGVMIAAGLLALQLVR